MAFKEQYKPHAMKLLTFYYTNVSAKCVEIQDQADGSRYLNIMDARCDQGNYILASRPPMLDKKTEKKSTSDYTQITGNNSRYSFELTRKDKGDYAITSTLIHPSGQPVAPFYLAVPVAGCLYGKKTFIEMADDQSIQFLEFEDCVWQKTPAKKLKIQILHHYGKANQLTTEMAVTFFFSPSDGWICRGMRGHAVGKTDSMREEIYFYEPRVGEPFPVLKRCERWITFGNPSQTKLQSATDITGFEHHKPFPESDFTLTAFGLPEPYGVVWKKPTPWYLWFIGLAVIFLALGWFFRRRILRRAAMIAPHLPASGS